MIMRIQQLLIMCVVVRLSEFGGKLENNEPFLVKHVSLIGVIHAIHLVNDLISPTSRQADT